MKLLVLTVLLISYISATNFDILSTSVCTTFNAGGYCTRWEQNGTVRQNYGSCFPGQSWIKTQSGFKKMHQIQIGDKILGFENGKEIYTQVQSWLHHQSNEMSEYLKISLSQGQFEVSSKHNIALQNGEYVFADETFGQNLFNLSQVKNHQFVMKKGKFSPKTKTNNFFVYFDVEKEAKVLAHSFAHIRKPQMYEFIFNTIMKTWDIIFGKSDSLVHPSFVWMQNTFTFLLE